ncbi:hypothetical protein [Eudoraea adriatica]|uniref:hypothetical protein n=1 Tax=Eudoraea adriatica TaxID=446681 RepID=UPI00035E6394|nr:hypothetical protein [Eudoraea adriatica]
MKGRRRPGGGRKSKEDEDRIRTLCISAMERIYGSEEKAFEHIARLSEDSFPHLKLLLAYAYGVPREAKSINVQNMEVPLFGPDENM